MTPWSYRKRSPCFPLVSTSYARRRREAELGPGPPAVRVHLKLTHYREPVGLHASSAVSGWIASRVRRARLFECGVVGLVARLLRVLPVARQIETRAEGWIVLASLELWDDHVVLHFAQEQRPAPGLMQSACQWSIADDLGTPYRTVGGGMGANRGGA